MQPNLTRLVLAVVLVVEKVTSSSSSSNSIVSLRRAAFSSRNIPIFHTSNKKTKKKQQQQQQQEIRQQGAHRSSEVDEIVDTAIDSTVNKNNDLKQNNNKKNINNNMTVMEKTAVGATSLRLRTVKKVLPRPPSHWVGDGFKVYPVFSNAAFTEEVSPLLMFDYAEPKHFPPRITGKNKSTTPQPLGVGQHPHRGFETVTVAFQGEVEHHDNAGNRGVICPGDVQWMTAGRGIIHEEYHSKEFTKNGGTFEMCQLWVNLPKEYKMTKPNYQAILDNDIPVVPLSSSSTTVGDDVDGTCNAVENDNNDNEAKDDNNNSNNAGATARLIAGELNGVHGAAKTFSPVQMWDVHLPQKDTVIDLPYPSNHNCMIFVRRGSVELISNTDDDDNNGKDQTRQPRLLRPQEVALMNMGDDVDGLDIIRIRVVDANSSILVLGGEPLHEPIAARGPFVMNTQEQLRQAIVDYQMGKF